MLAEISRAGREEALAAHRTHEKEIIVMRVLSLLWSLLFLLSLAACNTLEGAGEDIEAAGSAIEQESEENKPY